MLTPKQRELAIRHIVNQIHVPRMSHALSDFLTKFGEHIVFSIEASRQLGTPVMKKPPVFDYSHITEKLIQDVLTLEEMYNKSNGNDKDK